MTPFYSIGSMYRRPGRVRDQGDRLILTRFAVGVCVRIWGVFGRESHNRPVPLSVRDEHSREQRAHTHSAAHAVVGKLPQLPPSCRLDQINRVNEHQGLINGRTSILYTPSHRKFTKMSKEKVLLAYSGGLDTSCILKWLLEQDYEVICFMADVGQTEDFAAAREKALKIGAADVVVKDMKDFFVEKFVWPAVQMGLIYEDRYLLGTSLARPCISKGLMDVAVQRGCSYISHGATGKGNDQIRFELSCYALSPTIRVIAPWRMETFCQRFQGRSDLLEYAKRSNIPVSATTKAPWSMDANIMHISYESGILEDPSVAAPEELYQLTQSPTRAPDTPTVAEIVFKAGLPVRVTELVSGRTMERPVDILAFLNKAGGEHGVGRIDIVENRYIGLKSRGVYETPGVTVLHCAHRDLEIYCLDREVLRVKKYLADRMADYVYNGYWYAPEAEYVRKCILESQKHVSGKVVVEMFKGHVMVTSRESMHSLYNQELASMEVHGNFSPYSSTGFIEINAVRLREHHRVFGTANMTKHFSRTESDMKLI